MKNLAIAASLALSTLTGGIAANAYPVNHARDFNQERRIEQGVAQGQINPMEQRRLDRNEARIRVMERQARADGVVTPREAERLRIAHAQQDRMIQNARHNFR